jgi:hypothetical protein
MIIKTFNYKKADGSTTEREAIEVSAPRTNYLMLDMTSLEQDEKDILINAVEDAESYRDDIMKAVSDLVKWRTFKPEGITKV